MVVVLFVFRVLPPIFLEQSYPSPVQITKEDDLVFFIRGLFEEFGWQIVLIVCLWIQRNIPMDFGIIREIGSIFILSLLISLAQIVATAAYIFGGNPDSASFRIVIDGFQCLDRQYPLNQLVVMLTSFVMIIASIVYPLRKLKEEHSLLPIQQVYDLENNLRAFLLEPEYFKVFYNFLRQLEQRESRKDDKVKLPSTTLINFWTKITKFKLQEDTDPTELIHFLRDLDTSIFGKNIVSSLNESFQLLNDEL